MKLKVLKNYKDLQLERVVEKDEVIEVSDERGKVLLGNPNNIVAVVGTSKEFDTTPPLKTPTAVKEVEKPVEVEKTDAPEVQTQPLSKSEAKRVDAENKAVAKSKRRYKGAK